MHTCAHACHGLPLVRDTSCDVDRKPATPTTERRLSFFPSPVPLLPLSATFSLVKHQRIRYQVTYQMKIIVTAMFAVTLLGQQLNTQKWVSLFFLMAGVVLVQLPAGAVEGELKVLTSCDLS